MKNMKNKVINIIIGRSEFKALGNEIKNKIKERKYVIVDQILKYHIIKKGK